MALFSRSVVMVGSRSVASRSKTLTQKSLNLKPLLYSALPSPSKLIPRASRFVSVLASVESMMPLHSAIASSRLKSSLAIDSSCWSCLSQGLATPL